MHVAVFVAGAVAVGAERRPEMYTPFEGPANCTTTHLEVVQTKRFSPPRPAIWTTVRRVLAQVQALPGQLPPA
jgi:hypothetical protein